MKSSIKRDLSTLTTISPSVLSKLFDKEVWCISNAIEQTLANQDNIAEIDLSSLNVKFGILGDFPL